jgi:hypothetical protein
MRRRFVVIFVIATLAIGLGWQATASAHDPHGKYGPHGPMITTSSSTVDPGDSLTVSCRNFAPNESVVITLDGVFVGKTHTNRHGSCSIKVTVPKNTKPGVYTIVATGKTGDTASTAITVLKPRHNHHHEHSRRQEHHWWDFIF